MSQLFSTPWTVACQAALYMEFSRQEYWSGLQCPPSGDLPNPEIYLGLPHCRQIIYQLSHQGSPRRVGEPSPQLSHYVRQRQTSKQMSPE